jgi:hypothetical protein
MCWLVYIIYCMWSGIWQASDHWKLRACFFSDRDGQSTVRQVVGCTGGWANTPNEHRALAKRYPLSPAVAYGPTQEPSCHLMRGNPDERLEQFRLYESRRKTWTISTQCFGVQVAVSKFQIYIYLYIGAIAAQVRAALLSWSILERNGRLRPCCRLLLPMPVCVEAISDIYQLWYWPAAKWVPLWCISIPSLY